MMIISYPCVSYTTPTSKKQKTSVAGGYEEENFLPILTTLLPISLEELIGLIPNVNCKLLSKMGSYVSQNSFFSVFPIWIGFQL